MRAAPGRVVGVLLLVAATARAEASPPAQAPAAPLATPPAPALDFELFDDPVPTVAAAESARLQRILDGKVQLRRRLLLTHQALGLVTLAGLIATVVLGQLQYLDKYGGGDDSGRYYNTHLTLATGTSVLFATTGVLALVAPDPYPKPVHLDTALVHKLAMALATAGMVAQVVLGPITASREGHLDQRSYALAHLATGYATTAFMLVGAVVYLF